MMDHNIAENSPQQSVKIQNEASQIDLPPSSTASRQHYPMPVLNKHAYISINFLAAIIQAINE